MIACCLCRTAVAIKPLARSDWLVVVLSIRQGIGVQ